MSNIIERDILREANHYIRNGNVESLKTLFEGLKEPVNAEYLFKRLFPNACNYGNLEMVKYLYFVYESFTTDIEKIALKPVFLYSKVLSRGAILEFLKGKLN